MSLKAINESYQALLARALRSTVVAHINKYMRQMVATVLAGGRHFVATIVSGYAAIGGKNNIGWQYNGKS